MAVKRALPMHASEHAIQAAYFQWVRLTYPGCKLIYAVPNAAKRGPALASWMIAEGLTSGIPDINIDIPREAWAGMRIETKSAKGNPTDEQLDAHYQLRRHGYRVEVLRDPADMIAATKDYLGDWRAPVPLTKPHKRRSVKSK